MNPNQINLVLFYRVFYINPIPKDIHLEVTKLKAFADDNLHIAKMMIFLCVRAENTGGKGANAGYQHFLLFPQCFPAFYRVVKSRDCVVKS